MEFREPYKLVRLMVRVNAVVAMGPGQQGTRFESGTAPQR